MTRYDLPLTLLSLLALFLAQVSANTFPPPSQAESPQLESRDVNPNGTRFIWLPQNEYSGNNFFEQFDFFSGRDPTNGMVSYVNRTTAFQNRLAYVGDDGIVYMKGDQQNWLPEGAYRPSVRIMSKATYQSGSLFILDVNKIPWGCGVWPAFWTLGVGERPWPYYGEIDIIEGVHDNSHNQVAWHTEPGCDISKKANFTGTLVTDTDGHEHRECNAYIRHNAGCGIVEWSRASYGADFDRQGGGVVVMKWDEVGISVWSFFRVSVPKDIIDGSPDPSKWGLPSAELPADGCDIGKYFSNHQIILNIAFCGDWAGNSYTTTDCPGTCAQRLMDPANFINATWSINNIKVYRKQLLNAQISGGGGNGATATAPQWSLFGSLAIFIVGAVIHGLY